MQIETLILGAIEENCYIVYDENRNAAVIDPGDEAIDILSVVTEESLDVKGILLTHGHFDHTGAVSDIRKETGAQVYLHEQDEFLIKAGPEQAKLFGLKPPPVFKADVYVKEGSVIHIGDLSFKVLHTPGHTPGSVSFLIQDALFCGDTLFHGGIGRTDLSGGDYERIMQSIQKKILVLPGHTRVYSGHGPPTIIEKEKTQNPFLQNVV